MAGHAPHGTLTLNVRTPQDKAVIDKARARARELRQSLSAFVVTVLDRELSIAEDDRLRQQMQTERDTRHAQVKRGT